MNPYSLYCIIAFLIGVIALLIALSTSLAKEVKWSWDTAWKAIERLTRYADLLKIAQAQRDRTTTLAEAAFEARHIDVCPFHTATFRECSDLVCTGRRRLLDKINNLTLEEVEEEERVNEKL